MTPDERAETPGPPDPARGAADAGPAGEDEAGGAPEPEAAVTDDGGGELRSALPPRIEGWRRRSATGAILTGFALGLQQALEPERKEPAIVMQTSGDPPGDLPLEAEVEYARPRRSVVSIRPWLLGGGGGADAESPDPDGPGDATPGPGDPGEP